MNKKIGMRVWRRKAEEIGLTTIFTKYLLINIIIIILFNQHNWFVQFAFLWIHSIKSHKTALIAQGVFRSLRNRVMPYTRRCSYFRVEFL